MITVPIWHVIHTAHDGKATPLLTTRWRTEAEQGADVARSREGWDAAITIERTEAQCDPLTGALPASALSWTPR